MLVAILNVSGDVAITLLGAVVVAVFTGWLTAHTTNRRLDKQLLHERTEADRAELRGALDQAAAAVIALFEKLIRAANRVHPALYRHLPPTTRAQAAAEGQEMRAAASKATTELTPHLARLQLRLGRTHQTVTAFNSALDHAGEALKAIPMQLPGTDEQATAADHATQTFMAYMEAFIESAHEVVGTSAPALAPPADEAK